MTDLKSWRILIHDRKQSGANSYVTLTERIVLPRLIDAIGDLIELLEAELAELDAGGEMRAAASDLPDVEQMVIDFTDAFKIVPLHPLERGLAAGKVPNATDLFVYFSLCFGGTSCPLVWERYAAFLGRSTQSMYEFTEARLQVYVDDPWMSARGRPARRRVLFALALWWWLSLGFPLAYHKGQRGPVVDWIGATLSVHRDHVVALCMRFKAAAFGRDCSSVARHALVLHETQLQYL